MSDDLKQSRPVGGNASDDQSGLPPAAADVSGTVDRPDDEGGARPDGTPRWTRRLTPSVRRLGGHVRGLGGLAAAGLAPLGQSVRQDLAGAFGHLRASRRLGPILVGLALALYLLSGTYVVSPGEAAVVTRFGRVIERRVMPGLRWRLPWPIEAAQTVNVAQVRREGIGVSLPGHPEQLHPPEEVQLLTGDENLLTAKVIVQYRVREPADYLFRVDYNEDPLLRDVIKAALTRLAGGAQVDALLTGGRTAFQQQARDEVQQQLDAYRSGLEIVSIDLQEIVPPGDVAEAFRDVSSAAEEKNKLINDAQGYANSIIPQARGEAEKRQREAEGYTTEVVNRARGEATRFDDIVAQYKRDAQIFGPEVTRYRLYVEAMEQILPRAQKYIVQPGKAGDEVNLRLMEQLPAAPAAPGEP